MRSGERGSGGRLKGRDLAKLEIVLSVGGLLLSFSVVPFTGPD